MTATAISVESLGKRYRIESARPRHDTLRDALSARARRLLGRGVGSPRTRGEEFWALRDVSFEVQRGDVLGIIGGNGAGKSTLLKVLSRITAPTTGRAEIRGRVGSLLEVGTGFHSELTGRENTYLSGAILGMRRTEIDRRFDEIVAFAEIDQFIDTPVKHYSSGMYLRLAFAVAAHLEPEILIVDEVLAVGDLAFQRKCLGRMEHVAHAGRTVLFVSHNMAAIETLCTSGVVLHGGRVVRAGSVDECIAAYASQSFEDHGLVWNSPAGRTTGPLAITRIAAELRGEQPRHELELVVDTESRETHAAALLAVDILDRSGAAIMQALPRLDGYLSSAAGRQRARLRIELPPLVPGTYYASVWTGSHNTATFDEARSAVRFEIRTSPTAGRTFPHTPDHGHVVPHSTVEVERS